MAARMTTVETTETAVGLQAQWSGKRNKLTISRHQYNFMTSLCADNFMSEGDLKSLHLIS